MSNGWHHFRLRTVSPVSCHVLHLFACSTVVDCHIRMSTSVFSQFVTVSGRTIEVS